MFDQSFSEQNLFKIYSSENKKGQNLADRFFANINVEYKNLKRIRKLIYKLYSRKSKYSREFFESRVLSLYRMLRFVKDRKNETVRFHLKSISSNISDRKFVFSINKSNRQVNGKDVYLTGNSAASFFAEKQVQRNIKYTYGVKQADRDLIIPQVYAVLNDRFPKVVVKTDISSFYETIDRNLLLQKLNESPILSLTTRKLIARLLDSYGSVSGLTNGIPRGIGVSAYLSELYMKSFDDAVSKLPNLIYYARYVDDIIMVLTPQTGKNAEFYKTEIKNLLKQDKLELNEIAEKTKCMDIANGVGFEPFDYLGYKFVLSGNKLRLDLSDKKKFKYERRLNEIFESYKRSVVKQPKKSRRELFLRLKFLTSNTKLSNNKENAVVGIYNSNKWITHTGSLTFLDGRLINKAHSIGNPRLASKLSKFSFKNGFEKRLFSNFSSTEFLTITRVWSE